MADFRIRVVVDPTIANRGSDQVERGLSRAESKAQDLERSIKRAFLAIGSALAIRKVVELGDSYTALQNRLRVVTNGTDDLANATERVFDIANRTRSAVGGTAEAFTRFTLALKETDATQREVLRLTESVNKAIILSGASSAEAQAGLIQFSQGLASGALRGDELRSVLEQLPVIADIIAKQLGVTRGQLREMGKQGKITAEVIRDGFAAAAGDLDEQFGGTVPTISQAITVLANNFVLFLAELNEATGIFSAIGAAVAFLAENIKATAIAITVLMVPAMIRWISVVKAWIALKFANVLATLASVMATVRAAVLALTIAAHANPIGLLVVGIGAAIAAFVALALHIREVIAALLRFHEVVLGDSLAAATKAAEATRKWREEVSEVIKVMTIPPGRVTRLQNDVVKGLEQMAFWGDIVLRNIKARAEGRRNLNDRIRSFIGMAKAVLPEVLDDIRERQEKAAEAAKKLREEFTEFQESFDPVTKAMNDYDRALDLVDRALRAGLIQTQEEANALMRAAAKEIGAALEQAELLADAYEGLAEVGFAADPSQFGVAAAEREAAFRRDFPELVREERREQQQLSAEREAAALRDIELLGKREQLQNQALERQRAALDLSRQFASGITDVFFEADESARDFFFNFLRNMSKAIAEALVLKAILSSTGQPSVGATPIASLFGFAQGGRFTVGGSGGTDSQIVAFRATPGEHVTVQTPAQAADGGMSGGARPVVNVKSVVVADMRGASLEAQRSREGEQVFLEHARNNGLI